MADDYDTESSVSDDALVGFTRSMYIGVNRVDVNQAVQAQRILVTLNFQYITS